MKQSRLAQNLERGGTPAGTGPLLSPEYLDGPSTEGAAWPSVVCAASGSWVGAEDFEGQPDYPACGQRAGRGTHPSEGTIKRHLHFL